MSSTSVLNELRQADEEGRLLEKLERVLNDENVTELDLTKFSGREDVKQTVLNNLQPHLKRFLFSNDDHICNKMCENMRWGPGINPIEKIQEWKEGFSERKQEVLDENPRERVWEHVKRIFSNVSDDPPSFPDLGNMSWNQFKSYVPSEQHQSRYTNDRHALVYPFMNDPNIRNYVIALWLEYGCWDECHMYIEHFNPQNVLTTHQVSKLKTKAIENFELSTIDQRPFVYAIIGMYDSKTFPSSHIMKHMVIDIRDFKPMIRALHNRNIMEVDNDDRLLLRIRWYHAITWTKTHLPKCWCANFDNSKLFMDEDTPKEIKNIEEMQWIMRYFFHKRPFPDF